MGVADHALESITGHLSRRMLEHYSHIRIDANPTRKPKECRLPNDEQFKKRSTSWQMLFRS